MIEEIWHLMSAGHSNEIHAGLLFIKISSISANVYFTGTLK